VNITGAYQLTDCDVARAKVFYGLSLDGCNLFANSVDVGFHYRVVSLSVSGIGPHLIDSNCPVCNPLTI